MIDITMTACSRPKLIEKVFISLKKYMPDIELRLIINIAKAGTGNYTQYDVIDVVKRYFSNFIVRVQNNSNQTDGLFWAWNNAQSSFVLNWEDDWELLQHIDLDKLISYFDKHISLASILLLRKDKPNEGFSNKLDDNLYERYAYLGGPPSLIRHQFMKKVLSYMKSDEHFNQTIKCSQIRELLYKWRFGVYAPDNLACVRDLGIIWKQENGIKSGRTIKEGTVWKKI